MPLVVDELLVGAVVGAAASELLTAILDAKDKTSSFKSSMDTLKSTLETIIPKIERIKLLDGGLNTDIDNLISELKKGKDLVCKCSKINRFNIFQKYRYAKKLENLDVSLRGFFSLKVNVEIWSDTKRIWAHMQETSVMSGKVDQNECRCAVPEIPNFSVGMDVRIKELKTELFRDDVSMIGLCALGGSGKTTLAAKLCRDEQVKERFKDNIIFLTVSRSPKMQVIVKGLFIRLGGGNPFLRFQNDEDAVKQLGCLMKQKEGEPILLVLDDVWSESFLQKFAFRTVGYKILVTSRTEYKTFDSTYSLKMLSGSDSMSLFRHLAFPQDGNGNFERPNVDEDCVNEIVRGCKGLPLTLQVIALSLCGEPARKWRSMESLLRKGSSIFDAHKELLECLASSLDFLEYDLRECFLDLGLFSEDQYIPADVLIDIWVGLYELSEDDAFVNLLELSSRNLINLDKRARKKAGEIDGSFTDLIVTQHDVLRDLAIYKSREHQYTNQRKRLLMDRREDNIPKSWREEDHRPFDTRLVSIHTDKMFSSEWNDMQFSEAKVMFLSFSAENYTLPSFIDKMSKLKVLIISNDGYNFLRLSGLSSLCYLPQLKTLRLKRIAGPRIKITEPLKNLQKVSFVECHSFNRLDFDNISYIFPNLIEMDILYCSLTKAFPQQLWKIQHLKKLNVTNCDLFYLSEKIGDLTELEVLRLRGCWYLEALPDSIQRLDKLRFLDISGCTNLISLPEMIGDLCCLRKLDMRWCPSVRRLPRSAMDLRHLKDVFCDKEMNILWEALTLPDLNIKVSGDDLDWFLI